jgi:hypothetical protein
MRQTVVGRSVRPLVFVHGLVGLTDLSKFGALPDGLAPQAVEHCAASADAYGPVA